jgi:radical SAM superfamily enzyme YgiQ (UPF0313 family)
MLSNKKNKFIMIDPFCSVDIKNSASVGYLKGHLEEHGIFVKVINYNKLITKKEDFYFKNQLIRLLSRRYHFIPLDNDLKSLLFADYIDLHSYIYRWGPKEIWEIANKIKIFDKIFSSSLKNLQNETYYIGFSVSMNTNLLFSLILADYIKNKISRKIKIIFGGTLITLHHKEIIEIFKKNPVVDCLVVGDGEKPLLNIIKGVDLKKIPNLTFYNNKKKYVINSLNYYHKNVNLLSGPSYEKNDRIFIQSTGKCYWDKCAYCTFKIFSSKYSNYREPIKIINDLRKLEEKGLNFSKVSFTDACLSPKFLRDLSKEIINNKLEGKYDFDTFMRCDSLLNLNTLKLAKKAGFNLFCFGPETMSNRLLSFINKGHDEKDVLRILDNCNKIGIDLVLLFIANIPTQTGDELIRDLKCIRLFLKKYSNIKGVHITKFNFRPGSIMYKEPSKYFIKPLSKNKDFLTKMVSYEQQDPNGLTNAEAYNIFWSYYKKYFKNNKKVRPWFPVCC